VVDDGPDLSMSATMEALPLDRAPMPDPGGHSETIALTEEKRRNFCHFAHELGICSTRESTAVVTLFSAGSSDFLFMGGGRLVSGVPRSRHSRVDLVCL
jgi:hypothetical protein